MLPPLKTPAPQEPHLAALINQAVQDLAKRLQIPATEIEPLKIEEVVWPDGSMGCPQPGMMYTQVMVDGYRIILRHAGKEYAYHGGGTRPPFLCEQPVK